MSLRLSAMLLSPFALIAIFHHMRYAHLSDPAAILRSRRRVRVAHGALLTSADALDHAVTASAAAAATAAGAAVVGATSAAAAAAAPTATAPVPFSDDPSRRYPEPTLSAQKLLDGSQNWLPVPDAEAAEPSDLAWRKKVVAGQPCPPGRRPYHTILTAQASTYQLWQTKIMYYHFLKQQKLGGECTEMTGFTRLLSSRSGPDAEMDNIPTIVVGEASREQTRGFMVINRPFSIVEMLKSDEWRKRITEDYVYIAETDHILLRDIPNRATPKLNVAFFFPYMSPVPEAQTRVIKRYFDGDHLSVQPVGPSPAIMHVDVLRKLAPLWLDLSVKLKADRDADAVFGWVLEMWGYSLACAQLGIKNYVWQQLQIEPSSTWHQNVTAEDPFIYHYTFGVEYTLDGIPVVGAVGEWSLDKRHYFGGPPPKNLDPPPECAEECAWVWWRAFNEATEYYGDAWASTQKGTRGFAHSQGGADDNSAFAKALAISGNWIVQGDNKRSLAFFRRGRLWTANGMGKWQIRGERMVAIQACGDTTLEFDSEEAPTSFKATSKTGVMLRGALDPHFLGAADADFDQSHPALAQVQTLGPWAWAGVPGMGFFKNGKLLTPWGMGTYAPIAGSDSKLLVTFSGIKHTVTTEKCGRFTSVRQSDGSEVKGWVMLGQACRGGQSVLY